MEYWSAYIMDLGSSTFTVYDPNPNGDSTDVVESRHYVHTKTILDTCMFCMGIASWHGENGWQTTVHSKLVCPR